MSTLLCTRINRLIAVITYGQTDNYGHMMIREALISFDFINCGTYQLPKQHTSHGFELQYIDLRWMRTIFVQPHANEIRRVNMEYIHTKCLWNLLYLKIHVTYFLYRMNVYSVHTYFLLCMLAWDLDRDTFIRLVHPSFQPEHDTL